MAAVCDTPFSVTVIAPVGISTPDPIDPPSVVVAVPASMLGALRPVNDGVALLMTIVSLTGGAAL